MKTAPLFMLLFAALPACGNGAADPADQADATVSPADASPMWPDALTTDASPPPVLEASCAELPFRLPPKAQMCVHFTADGGCTITGLGLGDACSGELHVSYYGSLGTDKGVHITSTTAGVYSPYPISQGNGGSYNVQQLPDDEAFTIDVRLSPYDRRALTAIIHGDDSIELVSSATLPVFEDCPDAASRAVPYRCTRYNNPTWKPVDWQIFSAAYADLESTLLTLFPNHKPYMLNPSGKILGPGPAHPPPYDEELTTGMGLAGFTSRTEFTKAEWTAPTEITVAGLVVATDTAPLGVTPDEASGHYVDIEAAGMRSDGDLYHNGELIDAEFDSWYPPLNTVPNAPEADGYSHIPLFYTESTDYIPGSAGNYEMIVRLIDKDYNGWDIAIPFTITN